MQWDFSHHGEVKVTMEGFTSELCRSADIKSIVNTPASDQLFVIRDVPLLSPSDKEEFHSTVAKILYLAKRVRPDILLPTSFLSTRVQCPTDDDRAKLQRVLRYLKEQLI
jgi:hypothetical protein